MFNIYTNYNMEFIHNLNIIQHHNNEIHKNLSELYTTIENKIKIIQEKEEELTIREQELQKQLEEIKNFNKESLLYVFIIIFVAIGFVNSLRNWHINFFNGLDAPKTWR